MRRLLLALACLCAPACGGDAPSGSVPNEAAIEVGDVASIDAVLAKHRGRGVLLNFWATWCAPCVAEMPELLEVGREFREQGGDVVLVSYDLMIGGVKRDEGLSLVRKFAQKRKVEVPIVIYDAPDYEAINAHFELAGGVPATLAFDRNGVIVDREDGEAGKARFTEMMRKALAK